MYFNNIHIMIYLGLAAIGCIVGKFMAWCNLRMPQEKPIFSKEYFEENKAGNIKGTYIMMLVVVCLYVALLYKYGINQTFGKNLDLIKFLVLIPMLVSSFVIDYKHRILPNRLNMTIFETGIIFTFIYGINNLNIAKDMLLGMITGAVIFGVITLLGGLIAGKEAMGLGDVKFMAAIGLFFGMSSIAEISLLSFFIASIFAIVILIVRGVFLKSEDEYIPFGPFLVAGAIVCIFIPGNTIFTMFMGICAGISDKILSLVK